MRRQTPAIEISFLGAQDTKRNSPPFGGLFSFCTYGEFDLAASGGGRWIERGCAAGGGHSRPARSAAVEKCEDQRKPEAFFGHRKVDYVLPAQQITSSTRPADGCCLRIQSKSLRAARRAYSPATGQRSRTTAGFSSVSGSRTLPSSRTTFSAWARKSSTGPITS